MKTHISKSKYKNIHSINIENDKLVLKILPEHGGKIASFINKSIKREYLVQANHENYRELTYSMPYIEGECSGFDDMLPTIDECYCKDYPWESICMPDHGEVCRLRWEYDVLDEEIHMWVYGVRFPYRLDKIISFADQNKVFIKYTLKNLSTYEFNYIWAAHFMLNAEEGAEIIVPYKNGEDITFVYSEDKKVAKYGDSLKWPSVVYGDNQIKNMQITEPKKEGGPCYKFYFDKRVPQGWCGYKYPDQSVLLVEFPKNTVPYLGILINEGGFKNYHNLFLEPCTAPLDDPYLPKKYNKNSLLLGKSEVSWFVSLIVEDKS